MVAQTSLFNATHAAAACREGLPSSRDRRGACSLGGWGGALGAFPTGGEALGGGALCGGGGCRGGALSSGGRGRGGALGGGGSPSCWGWHWGGHVGTALREWGREGLVERGGVGGGGGAGHVGGLAWTVPEYTQQGNEGTPPMHPLGQSLQAGPAPCLPVGEGEGVGELAAGLGLGLPPAHAAKQQSLQLSGLLLLRIVTAATSCCRRSADRTAAWRTRCHVTRYGGRACILQQCAP